MARSLGPLVPMLFGKAKFIQHGNDTGHGFQVAPIEVKHHAVLAGGEIRRQQSFVFTLKFGDHGFKSCAHKAVVNLGFGKIDAILRQQGDIDIHRYFFTVDENAIAIKDDVGNYQDVTFVQLLIAGPKLYLSPHTATSGTCFVVEKM